MTALVVALALASAAPRPTGAKSAAGAPPPPLPAVASGFEHDLSTPNGLVAVNWPSLAYDRTHAEMFMAAEGFVRIFDSTGMEVHRFGDDGSLGYVTRVAPLDDGELIVLSKVDGVRALFRCDFRGEPLARFELADLPPAFADFEPDQLVYRGGKLYFAERGTMRVVVTDIYGAHRQSLQLRPVIAAAIPPDSERKPASSMDGFNVDAEGNLLVTMSTMFGAAVVTPAGEVRIFGTRGSAPGKFNIIGGIDAGEDGTVYVTDRLRSVVSVWDRELRHLGDFGYRGDGPSNLLAPFEIAVGNGRVFVAQAGKRGVKVFRVRLEAPEPAPAPPPRQPTPPRPPRPPRATGARGLA